MKFANKQAVVTAILRMPAKRYYVHIKSEGWRSIRRRHLEMYPICECCKLRQATQVHHITYKDLGHELPSQLMSVCVQCHHEIHLAVSDALVPANDNEPRLPLVGGSNASGY